MVFKAFKLGRSPRVTQMSSGQPVCIGPQVGYFLHYRLSTVSSKASQCHTQILHIIYFKQCPHEQMFRHLGPTCFCILLLNNAQHLLAIDKYSCGYETPSLVSYLTFAPQSSQTQQQPATLLSDIARHKRHLSNSPLPGSSLVPPAFSVANPRCGFWTESCCEGHLPTPPSKPVRCQPLEEKACVCYCHLMVVSLSLIISQIPSPMEQVQTKVDTKNEEVQLATPRVQQCFSKHSSRR